MSQKIQNTFNPLFAFDDKKLIELLRRWYESAPAFGSPENIAQLEAARMEGERFALLMALPTDTLPN